MRGALLVPDKNVADRIGEHRIVCGENGAAGIPEDVGNALAHQRVPQNLRTCELHGPSYGVTTELTNSESGIQNPLYPVTAPVAADETRRAYFASTPEL